jgi:hypothetical protein
MYSRYMYMAPSMMYGSALSITFRVCKTQNETGSTFGLKVIIEVCPVCGTDRKPGTASVWSKLEAQEQPLLQERCELALSTLRLVSSLTKTHEDFH